MHFCGGPIAEDAVKTNSVLDQDNSKKINTPKHTKKAIKTADKLYLVVSFIISSDRKHFGELIGGLENLYAQDMDNYPTALNGV